MHGDVFRQPERLMVLSSFLGTGSQLVILSAVVILYAMLGDLYAERATILTATIFLYALTSAVAGYTSARYYAHYGGKNHGRDEDDRHLKGRYGYCREKLGQEHSSYCRCVAGFYCMHWWLHQHHRHILL